MSIPVEHIDGDDHGAVRLYALSTCMWCRKTRDLLGHIGVSYDLVEVDLLDSGQKEEAMVEVKKWNPECTFPTLVVGNKKCIVGYQADKVREALGEWP